LVWAVVSLAGEGREKAHHGEDAMEGLIPLGLLVLLFLVMASITALVRAAQAARQVADLQLAVKILGDQVAALMQTREVAQSSPIAVEARQGEHASPLVSSPSPTRRPSASLTVTVLHDPAPAPLPEPPPTPLARPPSPPPPRPPQMTPPAGSPPPATPAFDWESLLGLKGAAWAGGIALVIAGILLAKLAIERGFITPELRVALLLMAGVGALVWAELSLRRGYATTANSVSGAGIALLYIAFFAAYSLYHLLPIALTFVLMALVTIVAGLVAIRYEAIFTAGLGLLGGFATPIVLSTGQDNPVGLFGYLFLLNVGLFAVTRRMRWHGLAIAALAGTVLIEGLWFARFMTPEKTLPGLAAFLALGLLYLSLLAITREPAPPLLQVGALGAIVPFVFAVLLAGDVRYAAEWPLLFGYIGLLDAALVVVAICRNQVQLLAAAALATALTLPLWALRGLRVSVLWGPTLSAIAIVALLNAPSRLAGRLAPRVLRGSRSAIELGGLVAWTGLGLYGLVLVDRSLGEPPWAFGVLLAALTGVLLERGRPGRIRGAMPGGSLGLALLTQAWFFQHTTPALLSRNLAVPLLLTLALSLAATRRGAATPRVTRSFAVDLDDDELGVVGATLVAMAGLFGSLTSLGSDPRPLFAALAVTLVLLITSTLRRDLTELIPLALVGAAGFSTLWHASNFRVADLATVLSLYVGFTLAFVALPFVVSRTVAPSWTARPLPWVTSALAGPAFFLVLYRAVVAGWGKAWIGVLPVTLAAVSVVALAGIARRFPARTGDGKSLERRLEYLALFAAVALGFVALAIPLQVDRQWITLGWALEALAVWWLFGWLPHPGLKYFGAVLYAGAGVRLLLNPEVLRYEPRGLPILNWLLYTYGVPALCAFLGAWVLARAEAPPAQAPPRDLLPDDRWLLAPGASVLGLLLVFWLVNLEIVDYFAAGRYVEFGLERQFARDLTMSVAWALYALVLLAIGLWRHVQPLRFASLGVLLLTMAKVVLYDLSTLEGLYRILSFLGLGLSLILVSLLYQRFVFAKQPVS
jgi:hypothetical protein